MYSSSLANSHTHRRSSWPLPARKPPQMIPTPGDSRRSLKRHDFNVEGQSDSEASIASVRQVSSKRHRIETEAEESSDQSVIKQTSQKTWAKKKSKVSKRSNPWPEINSSTIERGVRLQINLTQDSDEENRKVARKLEGKDDENVDDNQYDPIKDYFEDPIEGPKDVR